MGQKELKANRETLVWSLQEGMAYTGDVLETACEASKLEEEGR